MDTLQFPFDSDLPPAVSAQLEGISSSERRSELAAVYGCAAECEGVAVLVDSSPGAVMAAVAGVSVVSRGHRRVYVIDTRLGRLKRVFGEFCKADSADEITVYHGTLRDFFRDIPLLPGFLCVNRDTEGLDFSALRVILPARTPVLALGSGSTGPAALAVDRAVSQGLLDPIGDGESVRLYRTTAMCTGRGLSASVESRRILQGRLHERYFLAGNDEPRDRTFVSDITEVLRRQLGQECASRSGYGSWPRVTPQSNGMPATLPGGKPWPRISIVTPSYNQGRYIEETILSVLNQGYPNVEHIIVDGGSTDETRAVLEKYRNQVAHALSEPDNGQSHAINKGMALATGDILTWLNSDDMLAPGALAAVAMAFETNDAEMIAGICQLYRDGKMESQHLTACADGPLPLDNLLDLDSGWNAGQFFYQPEVMFTRELWSRAGGHVAEDLYYSMDYELWLRFAQAGARIHVIGRPLAWFRIHVEQKTNAVERFTAELVTVRERFLNDNAGVAASSAAEQPQRQKLRITMLNDHGAFFGAGIAHVRLARALAWAGHEINLVSILDRPVFGADRPIYTVQNVIERVVESSPDIVVVGNLHGADADPLLVNRLSELFPTLVVVHDFWILTGRCAYPRDCGKYVDGCDDSCPTPNEYPQLPPAQIADAWLKKRLLCTADHRPSLLTNSLWATAIVREAFAASPGQQAPQVETMRLSFPLTIFRPRDRRSCREALGLPLDSFIVFVPASLDDPRKGGKPLLEALARLKLPNLLVVTIGAPHHSIAGAPDVIQLGYVTDPQKIALINCAADVAAVPSLVETFGQVLVEAAACGTPVVGYPVPGVNEAIRDGVNGLLAPDTEPESMAAVIQSLYLHPEMRRDLAAWGRIFVENELSEFTAYHRCFIAFFKLGLLKSLNVRRKISFLANAPAAPRLVSIWQGNSPWRGLRGFSNVESFPEPSSATYQWALGPIAVAEVYAQAKGHYTVLIAYRNPNDDQHARIRCNGPLVGEFDLPNTGYHAGGLMTVETELAQGANLLIFEFSRWRHEAHDRRQLAVMIVEILVEERTLTGEFLNDLGSRAMLEKVWRG